MLLYQFVLLLLIVSAIIMKLFRYEPDKYYVIAFMGILFLLTAIRSVEVGNDTNNYISLFDKIKLGVSIDLWSERYESGYLFLNKLVASFTNESQVMLVITGLIIYVGFTYFIIKYSDDYFLSVYLFVTMNYFAQTMNAIRLCIAMSILMIAYDRLLSRHVMQFFIFTLLAAAFHRTAIVFLIIIIIQKIKCNERIIKLWMILTAMGFVIFPIALRILFAIFPGYQYYLGTDYVTQFSLGGMIYAIIWMCIFLMGYYIQMTNEQAERDSLINSMNLMMMIATSIFAFSIWFNLLDRVAEYFGVFAIVYFPNCIKMIESNRKSNLLKVIIMLLFMLYFIGIHMLRPEWNVIIPYTTFWKV